MNEHGHAWQQADLAKLFVEDVRGGIPMAAEQLETLLRVARHATDKVERFLDLGCGDGILGRTVQAEFAQAKGLFVDFSDHMIEAARKKADGSRSSFVVQDLAASQWTKAVEDQAPFDLVISGLAIHHLPDERKRQLYKEIFDLLAPGGLFLNLEHVSPVSPWSKRAFDELFVDSLWSHQRKRGGSRTREEIEKFWFERPDKSENILAPLELQCQWLQEIGYQDVDCFFKLWQLALFGGKKPGAAQQ
jgi:tRNA (cmo5U34)-methyltransferase